MTTRPTTRRAALVAAVFGSMAMFATMLAPAAGAQIEEGSCPASVDTIDEGWICSMLILDTPTNAPTDAQIDLWMDVLAQDGRLAVTDGIVFSEASVEAKVTTLYETQLNRSPDAGGLAHWSDRMQQARTELPVEYAIFGSGEYLSQFESVEAFVDAQYQYYLGRDASQAEEARWADAFVAGEVSNRTITSRIARSTEAGIVRARILYNDYARRAPDPGGLQTWTAVTASAGLFPAVAAFARYQEMVNTLGGIGMDLAAGTPDDSYAERDIGVAPQEPVTVAPGTPIEITVFARYDQDTFTGPFDVALFPCPNVTATDTPVTFVDANDDGLADGIASTATGQAYISTVNNLPTGGPEVYVDDVHPAEDGILRFDVVAPNPDCAVIAVFEDTDGDNQLQVDAEGRAFEPFGVSEVLWD